MSFGHMFGQQYKLETQPSPIVVGGEATWSQRTLHFNEEGAQDVQHF